MIGLKKNVAMSLESKRLLIEPSNSNISINKQLKLLDINKSSYYYVPCPESEENLKIMRLLDEQYLLTPYYGIRRMHVIVINQGYQVNLKRIQRLLRLMGLETIYPKPNLSKQQQGHKIYPYLLRGLKINNINQVWSSDITYIPMRHGFLYLVAVMDWFSRYILSWKLSNSLDVAFCLDALDDAFEFGYPEIYNTDQGSQFTSESHVEKLKSNKIKISMDGKGRALDNVFIERFWRSLKYEYVYLNAPETGKDLYHGLYKYINEYNCERPHSALEYQTPASIYHKK